MEKTENQSRTPAQTLSGKEKFLDVWCKIKEVIGIIVMMLYRLRKVAMAVPVVYYAIRLAEYNSQHLPQMVGLNLQASGEFAMEISKQLAVTGPLAITGFCLIMMFLSRKAMYSWAISIFTLILPVMLLLSNQYPA